MAIDQNRFRLAATRKNARLRLARLLGIGLLVSGSQVGSSQTPTYVTGEGLSTSYYLPPSAKELSVPPTLPDPVVNAPIGNGQIVIGSGVPVSPPPAFSQPPQSLPSLPVESLVPHDPIGSSGPSNQSALGLNSIEPGASNNRANAQERFPGAIDLDLRSNRTEEAINICSPTLSRPLAAPSPWFFTANALLLQRANRDSVLFSSSALDPSVNLLSTDSLGRPAMGGYELGGGRYFGSGRYAFGANYWGLFSPTTDASVNTSLAGPLATNLPFNRPSVVPGKTDGLFLAGVPMDQVFRNASQHRLSRDNGYHNVEMNLYWFALGGAARQPLPPECTDSQCWSISKQPTAPNAPWFQIPSRYRLSLYSGVRWFQFSDGLAYRAIDPSFPSDAYYSVQAKNDLWGVQTGALGHWSLNPRWSVWTNLNGGVYNNRGQFQSAAGDGTALATVESGTGLGGQSYSVSGAGNSTAFLGETTTGLGWHFARGWTANVGYRVLGVSGVGTAAAQIPNDFSSGNAGNTFQSNSGLLLHGVSLGATYNF